jgi:hypothetical protein
MSNKDIIMVDNRIHAKCHRCKTYKDAHTQNGNSFECGIGIYFTGGYNGYYDPFHEYETVTIELCHDCSVEVLQYFNVYDNKHFSGGHPSLLEDGNFCCDNCWVAIRDENNKWIGHKTPYEEVVYNHIENDRYSNHIHSNEIIKD